MTDRLAEDSPAARAVWQAKYQRKDQSGVADRTPADTWRRVASALASVEQHAQAQWAGRFQALMASGRFLPAGRILAHAGTDETEATLLSCFVMPPPEDDPAMLEQEMTEALTTLRFGGGIGLDLSHLAPEGSPIPDGTAPGPLARLGPLSTLCDLLQHGSQRPGAIMATLRDDHPDILAFINAKRTPGRFANANLSVLVSDALVGAVEDGAPWPLHWWAAPGHVIPAARLWDRLMLAAYSSAEPGVLFIDTINRLNNLGYCEKISATNPCGEVPLPAYGACNLGSLNLVAFVRDAFTRHACFDDDALAQAARLAVRMLDNALDLTVFPLPEQAAVVKASRRVGLGIMGLADALIMLGLRYDSAEAREWAAGRMKLIAETAYRASADLASERGPFPQFDRDAYLTAPFVSRLSPLIREAVGRGGIRNSHLLAIAPTGSISLIAGPVSPAAEPLFATRYCRRFGPPSAPMEELDITSYAVRCWHALGNPPGTLPPALVTADSVGIEAQLAMQAALQEHVDNSIAKTVTVADDTPFDAFAGIFHRAHALGLKGCTVYRSNRLRPPIIHPVVGPQA